MGSQKPENTTDKERIAALQQRMGELQIQGERVRLGFVKTEVEACLTAVQLAEFELRSGNVTAAEQNIRVLEEGTATLRRFLPGLAAEQRQELHPQLAQIEGALDGLKQKLRRKLG